MYCQVSACFVQCPYCRSLVLLAVVRVVISWSCDQLSMMTEGEPVSTNGETTTSEAVNYNMSHVINENRKALKEIFTQAIRQRSSKLIKSSNLYLKCDPRNNSVTYM